MNACKVCGGTKLTSFLRRARVPIHQNLIFPTKVAAVEADRGDLDMVACDRCGFVFNRDFDLARVTYGSSYDNAQCYSAYFSDYVDRLVAELVDVEGVDQSTIIEVGCGRGQFLRKLVEYPGTRNFGVGFDPSYVGPLSDHGGRLRFERSYYGPESKDIQADVVICRHVIEHVPEPIELLRAVRAAIAESKDPTVFFETPCVEWILRNFVLCDFFYEHCSLFSSASIRTAFETAGFKVESIRLEFEGQYLWVKAKPVSVSKKLEIVQGLVPDLARRFADVAPKRAAINRRNFDTLEAKGPVALWGAGAKGSTLAALIVKPSKRPL